MTTTSAERRPVLAVVGPTATGKSELALTLCEELGGEVINADALQLYRGMDIGTAKLSVRERRGIAHHLLDVLDVTDEASVAVFQRDSREAVDAIQSRGLMPVLVGGSGLYVRAALDRLSIPPTDPTVRARLQEEADEQGVEETYAVLRRLDPVAAAAIEPRNVRRIVRALEVIELTGQAFSATMPERTYAEPTLAVGLDAGAAVIDQRIDVRVERMWEAGLLREVRQLVAQGLREGRTASRAIGYAQALGELDGELTTAEAVASTQVATRRFARRQRSWFRPDPRITWFDSATPHAEIVAWVRGTMRKDGSHD